MAVSLATKAFIAPFTIASILQFFLLPAFSQPKLSQTKPMIGSTVSAESTVFDCISTETAGQYATIARRGQLVTPPMIVWQQVQHYTPQERCQIVSNRLTEAVQASGGKFGNLLLTYGTVNGQSVICYVSSMDGTCDSNNILLTLAPADRGNELEILRQLVEFGTVGSGGPLLRGRPQQEYAPLGTELERYLGEDEGDTGGI